MMKDMKEFLSRLVDLMAATIEKHKDELTELDQAIGDGDHGINMQRGFNAILVEKDTLAEKTLAGALEQAGRILVMKVGGASGPLYGSLFMAMGKNAPADEDINAETIAQMVGAGVEAVKMRGRSDEKQKTMLDVLIPAWRQLTKEADTDKIRQCAELSLANTRAMKALKGRAAFLGDRSIGHLDPGARSASLLIHAVCDLVDDYGS